MRLPGLPVSRRRHERDKARQEWRAHVKDVRRERDEARSERDEALKLVDHWYAAATDTAAHRNELYAAARKVHAEHGGHSHSPCGCNGCRALLLVLDGHDRQERGGESVTYPDGSGYLMSWEADGDH